MPRVPPLSHPRPAQANLNGYVAMIERQYRELPGLSLTPSQVRRLCGLDEVALATCEGLLDRLVSAGVLLKSPDGRYRRAA